MWRRREKTGRAYHGYDESGHFITEDTHKYDSYVVNHDLSNSLEKSLCVPRSVQRLKNKEEWQQDIKGKYNHHTKTFLITGTQKSVFRIDKMWLTENRHICFMNIFCICIMTQNVVWCPTLFIFYKHTLFWAKPSKEITTMALKIRTLSLKKNLDVLLKKICDLFLLRISG